MDTTTPAITRELSNLEDSIIRALTERLQELRQGILDTLVSTQDPFSPAMLNDTLAAVNSLITQFGNGLNVSIDTTTTQTIDILRRELIQPLIDAGLAGANVVFTPAQLAQMLASNADLIQNISDEMRAKINTQIRLAGIAGKTPYDAMKDITDTLGVKKADGIWGTYKRPEVVKGIAARAEAILRTELTRLYNGLKFDQIMSLGQQYPGIGIKKWWDATDDKRTRISHRAVQRETEPNPIPMNKPFIVGGAKMFYPGDPRGPAGEVVNCRCRLRIVYPSIEELLK